MNSAKIGVEQVLYRCMGITVDEDLLIVADEALASLGDLFYDVAVSNGLHAESLVYPTLPLDGMEPPESIADAILNSDVAILVTSRSITHTVARRQGTEKGVRIASLPGFNEGMLGSPLLVDYEEMAKNTAAMTALLTNAETARVVTPFGTDVTMSLKGRLAQDDNGDYRAKGAFGNLPAGEAYIAPVEGTAEGTIVYDGSMSGIGLFKEPIRVTMKQGEATEIAGGKEAAKLEEMLNAAGDSGRNLAELGVGANKGARLTGAVLEDEKVFGTIHFALGDNSTFGGKVEASCHLDGLLTKPDLYLDGRLVIEAGVWKI